MALIPHPFEPLEFLEIASVSIPTQTMVEQEEALLLTDALAQAFSDYLNNPPQLSLNAGGSSTPISATLPQQFVRGKVVGFDGTGVSRTVVCVDRNNGQRLAVTTSDADGFFELRPRTTEPALIIAVPLLNEKINAVVLDNIVPVSL